MQVSQRTKSTSHTPSPLSYKMDNALRETRRSALDLKLFRRAIDPLHSSAGSSTYHRQQEGPAKANGKGKNKNEGSGAANRKERGKGKGGVEGGSVVAGYGRERAHMILMDAMLRRQKYAERPGYVQVNE